MRFSGLAFLLLSCLTATWRACLTQTGRAVKTVSMKREDLQIGRSQGPTDRCLAAVCGNILSRVSIDKQPSICSTVISADSRWPDQPVQGCFDAASAKLWPNVLHMFGGKYYLFSNTTINRILSSCNVLMSHTRAVNSGLTTYTKIIGCVPWTQTRSSVLWQAADDWCGGSSRPSRVRWHLSCVMPQSSCWNHCPSRNNCSTCIDFWTADVEYCWSAALWTPQMWHRSLMATPNRSCHGQAHPEALETGSTSAGPLVLIRSSFNGCHGLGLGCGSLVEICCHNAVLVDAFQPVFSLLNLHASILHLDNGSCLEICCHCSMLDRSSASACAVLDLHTLPHTHVCRCSLWRRQMCLELGRRGVPTCMFSPVDHVFTETCHAWVYPAVTGALLTSSTEHCSECTCARHGDPVSSNRSTFNPLCLPHTPRGADGTMLRDDPYARHAPLRPDHPFAETSCARAVVTCLDGGLHDHNIFACTPLPVFRQRASERCYDGTWGRYTIKVCDTELYHHITFLSSTCCAMPQPGTPLQPGVFTVGRGRPCDPSHTDGRSVDSPLHEFRDAEINESAELGTPANGMPATVPAFHASAVVTGGGRKRAILKKLGIYARLCLRLTSRLPVISPGPSMLATLSYTVPRPTIAARLRPRPRAVAKMLVRSRLRCQCCFHRLGFCVRENAWLSRPCAIWDCHGLSMELASALSLFLPRTSAQVSRHTACDLPCQALCGLHQFEEVDVTMRRVPGFHACILMDPTADVCKSVAYFAETCCQCLSRCDTNTCTFAPSLRHSEGSGIVYQKVWFCRPPVTIGCALTTCCPVMQSLEPMFPVWLIPHPGTCLLDVLSFLPQARILISQDHAPRAAHSSAYHVCLMHCGDMLLIRFAGSLCKTPPQWHGVISVLS